MDRINALESVAANVTAWLAGAAGPSLFPAALGFGGGGEQRRGESFVQSEKMLHRFAAARKRLLAIKRIDRTSSARCAVRRSAGMTSG